MPIQEHPKTGAILMCDFTAGFKEPEMVKLRPVVILSPKISTRPQLCTVVPISTTAPRIPAPYHCELENLDLPPPYDVGPNWIKGDMVVSVGFHRLNFVRIGKDVNGNRLYRYDPLPAADLKRVRSCVLAGLGLAVLTKHLP